MTTTRSAKFADMRRQGWSAIKCDLICWTGFVLEHLDAVKTSTPCYGASRLSFAIGTDVQLVVNGKASIRQRLEERELEHGSM